MSVQIVDHLVGMVDNACNHCSGQDRRFEDILDYIANSRSARIPPCLKMKSNRFKTKSKSQHVVICHTGHISTSQGPRSFV